MDPLLVSESWIIYRIGEADANSVYKLAEEQELATRRSMAML
jgi:hypothetical protein